MGVCYIPTYFLIQKLLCMVFDSIPASSSGCFELHRQLATILHCSTSYFKVCQVDVQCQSGGSDCGLFAIAFALMLCQREDPRTVSFLQSSMRGHLVQCFEQEVIGDFPHSTKPRRTARSRFISEITVPVYSTTLTLLSIIVYPLIGIL